MEEYPDHLDVKGLHPDMFRKIEPGMEVFLMNHNEPVSRELFRRTPVKMTLSLKGSSVSLQAVVTDGPVFRRKAVTVLPLPADYQGSPMDPDRIDTQLHKTLDTAFEVTEVKTEGDIDLYCPVSFINELRRENLRALEEKITKRFKRNSDYFIEPSWKTEGTSAGKNLVMYTYPTIRLFKDILKSRC